MISRVRPSFWRGYDALDSRIKEGAMSMAWPMVKLGEVLRHYQEYIEAPEPRMYPKLSVKLYGRGVVLDSPADGASLKMQCHQLAKAGQVILSEIWGKKGAIGLVPPVGDGALCTSHFYEDSQERRSSNPRSRTPNTRFQMKDPINRQIAACLIAAGSMLACITSAPAAELTNLRCEYRDNPPGIDAASPRLSWVIADRGQRTEDRGRKQTAYQILVASTAELLAKDVRGPTDSNPRSRTPTHEA